MKTKLKNTNQFIVNHVIDNGDIHRKLLTSSLKSFDLSYDDLEDNRVRQELTNMVPNRYDDEI